VFALEVLPLALLGAFVTSLLLDFHRPARTSPYARVVLFVALAVPLTGITFNYFLNAPIGLTIGAVAATVSLILAEDSKILIKRVAFVFVSAIILAYTAGYIIATPHLPPIPRYLKFIEPLRTVATTTIETKSGGTITAKVMRSGDRGVLFYNEQTNQATLLRWDEIKQINTTQAP
jgi:hypothetical protein